MEKQTLEPGIYFDLAEEVYFRDSSLSRSDLVKLLDSAGGYWKDSWMNTRRESKQPNDEMSYGKAFHYLLFEPHKFKEKYAVVPIDEYPFGKEMIKYEKYFAIMESIAVLRQGRDSSMFLSNGIPEVTIVFDDGGLRYRVRIDYFTPVCSTDFKTTRSLQDGHIKNEFHQRGYDIQMALYKRARVRFKEQWEAGEASVYGTVDAKLFERFLRSEMNEFLFIFQRTTKPYPFRPLMPEDDTEQSGITKIAKASHIYMEHMRKYGTNEWPVSEGIVQPWSMFFGTREERDDSYIARDIQH